MTSLRRAFVAVVPPPSVLDRVESLIDSLDSLVDSLDSLDSARSPADGLRWVPRDRWHCTLQFLGPVLDAESLVESLAESLAESGESLAESGESLGESLRRRTPTSARLGGAGGFPATRRATVLWLGFAEGRVGLADLAAVVEGVTGPFGHVAERRPFRPHVTVARSPRARDVGSLVAELGSGPVGPSWIVGDVVLFDSDTRPSGAVYREVARLTLSG